jgi:thioredoxin 1
MPVAEIESMDFDAEVLKSEVPVIVDFYTPHCGPCRSLAPVFEKFAEGNPGVKFVKMNAEDNLSLSSQVGVRGVPTVIAFKNGAEAGRFVGFKGETALKTLLETVG